MKKLFSIILLSFPTLLFAQELSDQVKKELVEDWKRAKAFTLEYIEAMPEDKINFRAADSIRSFSEQLLHMAQGTIGLSANASGMERIYAGVNLEEQEEYKNKESLTKVVTEAYDFAIRSAEGLDMSKATEMVARGPFNISRLSWMRKAFEHQSHHRGQCTIYLRLAGVTPPNEKLF